MLSRLKLQAPKEFVDGENAQEAEFREPNADKANGGWSVINVHRAASCLQLL